jgi:rSAM/selenodomain-associated transferase 1
VDQALVIFARYPEAGSVKTRLIPDLTPAQATALYSAMTEDAVSLHAADPEYDTIVCFSPEESRDDFKAWLGEDVRLMPQEGDELGARQLNAFRSAFSRGYEKAVIIGSDNPCVTRIDVKFTFGSLKVTDVVLGPSEDGGYYLIGARKAYRELFEDIEWGGTQVLDETLKKAETAGISVNLIDRRFDIDRIDDVRMLYSVLTAQVDRRWVGPVIAKRTLKVLHSIFMVGE